MSRGSRATGWRAISVLIAALVAGAWPSSSAVAAGMSFQEFQGPCGHTLDLTAGPDGNLWILAQDPDQVWRMTPQGVFTTFPIPGSTGPPCGGSTGSNLQPMNIAAGRDGNLWFTEHSTDSIVRVTMAGAMTVFHLPDHSGGSAPWGITSGPDCNIWFSEYAGDRVGRITPDGSIKEFQLPGFSPPIGITTGPDGNVWFAQEAGGIEQIAPDGGNVIEHPTTPSLLGNPAYIATGSDGNLWFTDNNHSIGRMTTSGVESYFPIPTPHRLTDFDRIVPGPDGALWFDDLSNDAIGRIDPSGSYDETSPPTPSSVPSWITVGPDGNIWFTESSPGRIGLVTLAEPTRPGAPWSVTAAAADGSATVSWTVPTFDGHSPITGYTITPYVGSAAQTPVRVDGAATTSATLTDLTPGVPYGFEVSAVNGVGVGQGTRSCGTVTPLGPASAPTSVTAIADGGGQATVSWNPPVNNGGQAITYYAVYAYPPMPSGVLMTPNPNSVLVSGLAPDSYHVFTVTAYNGRWGPWSAWSPWLWVT